MVVLPDPVPPATPMNNVPTGGSIVRDRASAKRGERGEDQKRAAMRKKGARGAGTGAGRRAMSGSESRVALVGMGSGGEGEVTARAASWIRSSDVVVADGSWCESMGGDRLRSDAAVVRARDPREARERMIQAAREGKRVARLRQGDGWREAEALRDARELREAGIGFEIVPGVRAEDAQWERWLREHPMHGRRVVVTRAAGQAQETAAMLRERGAEPWIVPTIELVEPPEPELLRQAVREVGAYAVVAFTSVNGVERFFEVLRGEGLDARALGASRIAAIGSATARALEERGIRADVVAKEYVGESLAEAIGQEVGATRGKRVLIPRALEAREALPEALRGAGFEVRVVAAYETRPAGAGSLRGVREALEDGGIDAVLLTSGSTVAGLCGGLGEGYAELLRGVVVASIGPVTTRAAEARGLRVGLQAAPYTVTAMIERLERHWEGRESAETEARGD